MRVRNLLINSIVSVFLFSCQGNKNENPGETPIQSKIKKEDFSKQIKSLQAKLTGHEKLDNSLASSIIKAYTDYAFSFPDDTLAADYLFKAAEVSSSIMSYQQAIIYYQTIHDKYPKYKFAAESLYLQAYLFDNYINDDHKAKEFYEKVISLYPQHKLADDSKYCIKNLGKSDEELIKEFQKKNK